MNAKSPSKKQAKKKKKAQQQSISENVASTSTMSPEELRSKERGYSLARLQKTFRGYIEPDVVALVASNYEYVLYDTIDCLVNMMNTERAQREKDLRKLISEFHDSYWRENDIEDIYKQCNYDYHKTCQELADFIDEAMAKQEASDEHAAATSTATIAKKKKPSIGSSGQDLRKVLVASSTLSSAEYITPPSNNILLGPENIEHLQKIFEEKDPTAMTSWASMTTALSRAKMSGRLHVPLDDSTWAAIEQNLERHVSQQPLIKTTSTSSLLGPSTSIAGARKISYDPKKDVLLPTSIKINTWAHKNRRWEPTEGTVESFQEIVAEQKATTESAQEYAHLIEHKLKSTKDLTEVEEMRQEVAIESYKKFLIKNFPGFEPSILINLLEANGYDLHQTVMDIDPKSFLLKPLNSQACSSSGLGSSDSGSCSSNAAWPNDFVFDKVNYTSTPAVVNRRAVASESGNTQKVSDEQTTNEKEPPNLMKTDSNLAEKIAALVEERKDVHLQRRFLKMKLEKINENFYRQEIDRYHYELNKISEQIQNCFQDNT